MARLERKSIIFSLGIFIIAAAMMVCFTRLPATAQEGEEPLYPGYPLSFDERGHFDALSGDKIIINDVGYTLAPGATFNTPTRLNSGPSAFQAGDVVGFILDTRGEIESLWLIERNPKKK